MSEMENAQGANCDCRKKRGLKIAGIVLLILSLPIVVPVAVCILAAIVMILAALACAGLAVLAGIGFCVLAVLVCLAMILFCGVVGIGFAIVLISSAPASGLALLGLCLMLIGAGVIGCYLCWQIGRLFVWAAGKLFVWIGHFFTKGNKEKAESAAEKWEECEVQEDEA